MLNVRSGFRVICSAATYPSTSAALAVHDFPALLSSGSYQLATSNLSVGMGPEQFLPSARTFQKLSRPSPVGTEAC